MSGHAFDHPEVGAARFPARLIDPHPSRTVHPYGRFDGSLVIGHDTVHDRTIGFFDAPVGEEPVHVFMRFGIFRIKQYAARVLVEPVNDQEFPLQTGVP